MVEVDLLSKHHPKARGILNCHQGQRKLSYSGRDIKDAKANIEAEVDTYIV